MSIPVRASSLCSMCAAGGLLGSMKGWSVIHAALIVIPSPYYIQQSLQLCLKASLPDQLARLVCRASPRRYSSSLLVLLAKATHQLTCHTHRFHYTGRSVGLSTARTDCQRGHCGASFVVLSGFATGTCAFGASQVLSLVPVPYLNDRN